RFENFVAHLVRLKFWPVGRDEILAMGDFLVNHRHAFLIYNESCKEIKPACSTGAVIFSDFDFASRPVSGTDFLNAMPKLVVDDPWKIIFDRFTGWRPNSATGVSPGLEYADNRFAS